MSSSVVDGYTKIEDKFVDQYLTHDGESIQDAKKRLKEEQEMFFSACLNEKYLARQHFQKC